MKLIRKLFLISMAIAFIGFFIASQVQFKETKFSYGDIVRLKLASLYNKSVHDGQFRFQLEDAEIVSDLSIPYYKINIKEESWNEIQGFYDKYEEGSDGVTYTKKGIAHYKGNRKWIPAKLESSKEELKFRTHGVQPDQHRFGDYFSFQLKSKNKPLFGQKKIKFIIGERIGYKTSLLKFMSDEFNLIWSKPSELVKVQINDLTPKLFFLEKKKPISDFETLEQYRVGDFKSSVDPFGDKNEFLVEELPKSITDSVLCERYIHLNNVIASKNTSELLRLVDEEYMINYFIAKTIFGFSGHECYGGNWHMFYNPSNGKFYPSVNREPTFTNIDSEKDLRKFLSFYNHFVQDRSHVELKFYSTLLNDDDFYSKFKTALTKYLSESKSKVKKAWDESHEEYDNFCENDAIYSALYVDLRLEDVQDNLDAIEKMLGE